MKKTITIVITLLMLLPFQSGAKDAVTSEDEMLARFLKYVKVNSQSQAGNLGEFTMTEGQQEMARMLEAEIKSMGGKGVECYRSDDAYVYVSIPSNLGDVQVETLGVSCHLDFTPEAPGGDIKPNVIRNYRGGDIRLNDSLWIKTDSPEGADLKECIGKTIIHTDGTTLLGGDDKNGCAISMSLIETIIRSGKEFKHGPLQFVFCPNEDIGLAAERIDTTRFNPDILIDIDGEGAHDVLVANFTASAQSVVFHGHDVHPGDAKQLKYGDALAAAAFFMSQIPIESRPENSEGRQGYIHPWNLEKVGHEDYKVDVRIRYFAKEEGELLMRTLAYARKMTAAAFPNVGVELAGELVQYENVAYSMWPESEQIVQKAMDDCGVEGNFVSVRGGTTASMFAAKGLKGGICLFSGQHAIHSVFEYSVLEEMYAAFRVMLNVIGSVAQQ